MPGRNENQGDTEHGLLLRGEGIGILAKTKP